MQRIILVLVLFLGFISVSAHAGEHVVGTSIFNKDYSYIINNADTVVGQFYVKRAKVKKNGNEKLRIEYTIFTETVEFQTDSVDDIPSVKMNIKYNEKESLLSFEIKESEANYYFNFYIDDDLLNQSNPGSMVIYDKVNNSFTVANVTLDPVIEAN